MKKGDKKTHQKYRYFILDLVLTCIIQEVMLKQHTRTLVNSLTQALSLSPYHPQNWFCFNSTIVIQNQRSNLPGMNTVKPRSLSDIWPNQKSNNIFVEIPPKRDYVRVFQEAT